MDRRDYAYDDRDEYRAAMEVDRHHPQPEDEKPTRAEITEPWERRR